ncbi:type II toxin-antitoxin system VapB family antitoxin [Brevundimonas sp.]|jgi:Arc/MetJ family transcription regulator|uniref:type II toxin-antitoxin system VapB family antitoxin n=1 Tax=Brevundimonas sp. TaxID=1871086 RepID=UPI002FDB91E0
MRTTVTLDDDLMAAAAEYSGLTEKSAIIRLALQEYVSAEASRRLAKMGGSQPDFQPGPRKRYWVEED